jgi:hypothetical protein
MKCSGVHFIDVPTLYYTMGVSEPQVFRVLVNKLRYQGSSSHSTRPLHDELPYQEALSKIFGICFNLCAKPLGVEK